jgi:hypothetical protein
MRAYLLPAAASLAMTLASTVALAQAPNPSESGVRPNVGSAPAPSTAPTEGANRHDSAPSIGPWTADNVTAERPFGAINTDAAGTTSESMRTWAQGRTASERSELSGRCTVITNPTNASRYSSETQRFCRDYMMVANVPSPDNPSGVPGAASTGQSGGQLKTPSEKQ